MASSASTIAAIIFGIGFCLILIFHVLSDPSGGAGAVHNLKCPIVDANLKCPAAKVVERECPPPRVETVQSNDSDPFCIKRDGSVSSRLSCQESDNYFYTSEEAWKQATRYFQFQRSQPPILHRNGNAFFQANAHPDIGCFNMHRIGNKGDGGKFICDLITLRTSAKRQNRTVIVYSLGSRGDFSFETAWLAAVSNSEIHTFDIDPYNPPHPKIQFHHWGIQPSDGRRFGLPESKPLRSLPETLAKLGHQDTLIDVFKMDIEGPELEIFLPLLPPALPADQSPLRHFRIVLLEVHFSGNFARQFGITAEKMHKFLQGMSAAGFALYLKEPNTQYSDGGCIEIAWVRAMPPTVMSPMLPPTPK